MTETKRKAGRPKKTIKNKRKAIYFMLTEELNGVFCRTCALNHSNPNEIMEKLMHDYISKHDKNTFILQDYAKILYDELEANEGAREQLQSILDEVNAKLNAITPFDTTIKNNPRDIAIYCAEHAFTFVQANDFMIAHNIDTAIMDEALTIYKKYLGDRGLI